MSDQKREVAMVIRPQPEGGTIVEYSIKNDVTDEQPDLVDPSAGTTEPFPVQLLPQSLRSIVDEGARLFLLPPDLPAVLALGAVSSALGQGIILRNPPHSTAGNLFLLLSAPSGTGKSIAFRFIMDPLYRAERERLARFNAEDRPRAEADLTGIEAKISGLRRDLAKPRKQLSTDDENMLREELEKLMAERERVNARLQPIRLIAEDATSQRLAMLLAQSGETIALLSSDAGDVVSNIMGRWNQAKRTDESILLKAYSRDPYTPDRVGRSTVALQQPCATVVLVVTPDELVNLFSVERLSSGGLLPRFLILPSAARPQPDEGQREPNAATVAAWTRLIGALLETYRLRDGQPVEVTLAEGAAAVFSEYRNNDFVARYDEQADVAPFVARHAEQAARLALVLHVAEHGRKAGGVPLSRDTANAAVGLGKWFAARQTDFMRRGRLEKLQTDASKLASLVANGPGTLRDLQRRHGFEPERVRSVARNFPALLMVETVKSSGAGRPSEILRLVAPNA